MPWLVDQHLPDTVAAAGAHAGDGQVEEEVGDDIAASTLVEVQLRS